MPKVAAYTKNGARIEKATTSPPTSGPAIPPKRKPLWYALDARPRCSALTVRSSSDRAETVNIVDPRPPTPRRISSCVKFCEKPAARLEIETMMSPVDSTERSLKRLIIAPAAGELMNRTSANTLMTELAARAETPKVRANTGMAGARMPKPRATQKATAVTTPTSSGRPFRKGVRPSA